jgi:hypothetical protein
MNWWSGLPIVAIGLIGVCLLGAAFALNVRSGGWTRAMQSSPQGRWNPARRLMLIGALLVFLSALGCLILDSIQRRSAAPLIIALSFSVLLGIPILYGILRARR